MCRFSMITIAYAGLCVFGSLSPDEAEAFNLPAQPTISRIATDYYQDGTPQDSNSVVPDDVDEEDEADDQPTSEVPQWPCDDDNQTFCDDAPDAS